MAKSSRKTASGRSKVAKQSRVARQRGVAKPRRSSPAGLRASSACGGFSKAELYDPSVRAFTGPSLKMISFPLGGIGTGTIGLGGRGELRDWEIFNNPNLGYRPLYSMPYLFLRQGGEGARGVGRAGLPAQQQTQAYVLERQLLPHFHDGAGLPPNQLPGLPRLKEALFVGTYPMARIVFQDDRLPVEVSLTGFNPMIPMDADNSAIPAAILIYRLRNPGRKPVEGTLAFSMANVVGINGAGIDKSVNDFRCESVGPAGQSLCGIEMTSEAYPSTDRGYGSMVLAAMAKKDDVTWVTDSGQWGWFDVGQKLWDDFSADGKLDGVQGRVGPFDKPKVAIGMLGVKFALKAGEAVEIPFIISWCFPNHVPHGHSETPAEFRQMTIKNHYADLYPTAWAAAAHVAKNFAGLLEATQRFERALFDSTLPGAVLDAVSSQMAILRTTTTMWLDTPEEEKFGRIHAYEGCNDKSGCCPMNCTHVWNYEQSLAHLYPALERTMRLTDYKNNLTLAGAMSFRTTLPLRPGAPLWRSDIPCADGQFGTVIKAYREWRISGDDAFLKDLWPQIKKSIQFAWTGPNQWDADKDGVMEGVQHNTYDIEFFGPNTMCGSLYLAALKAGAEMAKALGDDAAAAEFSAVYESGSKGYEALFNGEYYEQQVRWQKGITLAKDSPAYSDPNALRYQYGKGCLSDQMLGQWAAHVAGLGHVFQPQRVRKTMESIFRHNFRSDLSEHQSCQRVYALNDEGGLVLCTWPHGQRDTFPFPYSDEIWTGIEYQVAAHLIYEGLVDEGLAVVTAARDRHDGIARNPWDEFECGDHYARAMASWSTLLALTGQRYDGRSKTLTIRPALGVGGNAVAARKINSAKAGSGNAAAGSEFQCFFTAAKGYGTARCTRTGWEFICHSGEIAIQNLELPAFGIRGIDGCRGRGVQRPRSQAGAEQPPAAVVKFAGKRVESFVAVAGDSLSVRLAEPIVLRKGQTLEIVG